MKVAICLSGQCRLTGQWSSLHDRLFSCLPQADYFFHFWKDGQRKGVVFPTLEGKHLEHVLDLFGPVKYLVEDQKQVQKSDTLLNFEVQSMFYSILQSNNLKKQHEDELGFKYDCVIRVRTDINIKDTLELSDYSDLDLVHVRHMAESNNLSHGVNDHFAYGNSSVMDQYAECYNHIEDPCMAGLENSEIVLARHIDVVAGLKCKGIKRSLFWW